MQHSKVPSLMSLTSVLAGTSTATRSQKCAILLILLLSVCTCKGAVDQLHAETY